MLKQEGVYPSEGTIVCNCVTPLPECAETCKNAKEYDEKSKEKEARFHGLGEMVKLSEQFLDLKGVRAEALLNDLYPTRKKVIENRKGELAMVAQKKTRELT